MDQNIKLIEAAKEIIKYGKKLTKAGVIGAQEGNLSCKVGDVILITPSAMAKDELRPEELAVLDLEGNWIGGPHKPSSESAMHVAMYKMRPDVTAIVHTHSPYCTAFAMAGEPVDIRNSAEFAIFYRKVPVIPYGEPGTHAIYKGMSNELVDYDTLLLENHGVVSVGKDLCDASSKCSTLELVLRTYTINRQLFPNRSNDLSQRDLEKLWKFGRSCKHGAPQPAKKTTASISEQYI